MEQPTDIKEILKTVRSIREYQDFLAEQIEYTQCILAAFHPDPALRKFANARLKEVVEFLDPKIYDERFQGKKTDYPSSDTLFISQMFYELAQTFEKAAPNRTPES
jgi:hypothetical protein